VYILYAHSCNSRACGCDRDADGYDALSEEGYERLIEGAIGTRTEYLGCKLSVLLVAYYSGRIFK